MKIICQFVKLPKNFHNFCPKYIPSLPEFSHCFCPNFSIAFAQISHCFCPNFGEKQLQIQAKAMGNWGKSNGKIEAKAMRKLRKRWHIFRAKIIAFSRISHCFCPNFPLLCPNFSLFTVPPPPTPMLTSLNICSCNSNCCV